MQQKVKAMLRAEIARIGQRQIALRNELERLMDERNVLAKLIGAGTVERLAPTAAPKERERPHKRGRFVSRKDLHTAIVDAGAGKPAFTSSDVLKELGRYGITPSKTGYRYGLRGRVSHEMYLCYRDGMLSRQGRGLYAYAPKAQQAQ